MKTKKAIGIALVMAFAVSFAYWLGYQDGSTAACARVTALSSLRQVGLSFRGDRNDIGRFSATGTVVTPKAQTQKQ